MSRLHADLERQAAELRLQRAETAVEAAVEAAMRRWLETMRFLIINEAANQLGVTAAAGRSRHRRLGKPGAGGIGRSVTHPQPVVVADPPTIGTRANPETVTQAATGAYNDWARTVDDDVLPAVSIAFGEGFRAQQRSTPGGSFRSESEYMQTVHDRFKIWPQGAFEEVRPELVEALAEAETIEQITDRVGMVLGIDKDQRAIKARINEVEDRLKVDGLDKAEIKALRAERRRLWEAHDAEETQWRWKARRIARTEAHGAVGAGQIAAARRRAAETGEVLHKRWLATEDGRTRMSHRIADGQIVGLDEKFVVDGYELDFPGDPVGPGHVSINCRCSMRVEDPVTLQEQLQGPDGAMGEIRPGGVRLGPDNPDTLADLLRSLGTPNAGMQNLFVSGERVSATAGRVPGSKPPNLQSVDDLLPWMAPDDDHDRYFLPKEKVVADWLRDAEGVAAVVSVDRSNDDRHPDSVVTFASGKNRPVEFKVLDSPSVSAVRRSIRQGRTQARIVVIDGTRAGLSRGAAEEGLLDAVRKYGHDLDQVVIRLGGGGTLSWEP